MKKIKGVAMGRLLEAVATLSDDEKARAAYRAASPAMFSDLVIQMWPSRGALKTMLSMQDKRERQTCDWKAVVK